jgi:hypothetical protein
MPAPAIPVAPTAEARSSKTELALNHGADRGFTQHSAIPGPTGSQMPRRLHDNVDRTVISSDGCYQGRGSAWP